MPTFVTTNHTKSLGTLRVNRKTKEKSPELVGTIKMHRRLITVLWKELNSSGGDEVTCNLAAWQYRDKGGPLLNVEVSEKYSNAGHSTEDIFELLARQQEE
jgi:hypothetical protein